MKTYEHFATVLAGLLGSDTAIRLTVDGYMPLSVEDIGQSAEGNRLISICHYGEQNGDLMRDPDMVFEVYASPAPATAEPLSFRNDYMGIMQEVYRYDDDGKKSAVNPKLKQDLKSFGLTWFQNLKDQGSGIPRRDRHPGATHLSRLPSPAFACAITRARPRPFP